MAQTLVEQKRPRGNKSVGSLSRIERDLKAYKLTLAGVTVRGVCEELGIKSTQTAFNAIARGKAYAIERGIDVEETRIKIHQLFDETLGLLAKTARHQAEKGVEEFFVDQDGNKSMRRKPGVDPRIAGELSRSLNRWAEFVGLLERAPEQNVQATTVMLTAPAAGADFESRYANMPAADASALEPSADQQVVDTKSTVVSEGGPGWGEPPADAA